MLKLSLTFSVSTMVLLIFSLKFGSFTLSTESPTQAETITTRTTTATTTTPITATTTEAPTNIGCKPDVISLTISDDLPAGDNSTKLQFFCNKWIDIKVSFDLVVTYEEHKYFEIQQVYIESSSFLVLTIKKQLIIQTFDTHVRVKLEPYKNVTVNIVPIRINVKEINDPPTILPDYIRKEMIEIAPVGTIIANLSISDPDDGEWGYLQIMNNSREDTVVIELFEALQISKNSIQIRTHSWLDADKFWNCSDKNYMATARGPEFTYELTVIDGGGLTASSKIVITIKDVGDTGPVCNSHTFKNLTLLSHLGEIANLGDFCRAQNYLSILFYIDSYNPSVRYALISDSCNLFVIRDTGKIILQHMVPNDIKTCNLSVKVTDREFTTLTTNMYYIMEFKKCSNDTDDRNIKWETQSPGNTSWHPCPTGYVGMVSRYCNESAVYQEPVYNCTKSFIDNTRTTLISVKMCLNDTDDMNIQWETQRQGKTSWHPCPTGYVGMVSRYCNESAVYQEPVYNCTKSQLDNKTPISVTFCLNDTDYKNIQWNTQIARNTSWHPCPYGYTGSVSRYCNENGVFQDPVYNCTKSSIYNIFIKLNEDTKKGQVDIIEVLDELSNATAENGNDDVLLIGDIERTIDVLAIITDAVTINTTYVDSIANSYIQTVNNILDESTTQTWKIKINLTRSGADVVLRTTDRFVEKILTESQNLTAQISKPNLYLRLGSTHSCKKTLKFPERERYGVSEWAKSREDELIIDCDNTSESFGGIMYRNISMIIPLNTKSEVLQLNAPVISFTLYPIYKRMLESPVEIRFQLFDNTLENAKCSFWRETKGNMSQGYWSDEGCRQKKGDMKKDVVVCVCDHLTNFAVLMSPSSAKINKDHFKALSIISMTGCIISIVFLVLSVAIHAFFWRYIKSVRSIIHTHLSCWLIVAYILFLVGINRTENRDLCTAMAVLLHLTFLGVISGMLTEGCNLSYTVLKPLSTRKPGIPLMIVFDVVAVVLIAISMGVSKLNGYGNDKICWLSTDTGLIWAFLIPVFVVVLINLIIVVLVIRTMCGTTAMSKKSNKGRAKAALRCILVLMPVMGLTWGFGALSLINDDIVFQYIFAVLNSFQGFLIFLFNCVMDKKIKDAFSKQKSKWLQTQSFGVSEGKKYKTQDTSF